MPPVGHGGPDLLVHHDHLHLLDARVWIHHLVVGRLVLVIDPAQVGPPPQLPEDEAQRVDVSALPRVKVVDVQILLQDLGGKVALGPDPAVDGDVDGVRLRVVLDAEPEVRDGAAQILLHQDVLALKVAVRDGGLA